MVTVVLRDHERTAIVTDDDWHKYKSLVARFHSIKSVKHEVVRAGTWESTFSLKFTYLTKELAQEAAEEY